jgi:general stress protein YciG
VNKEPEVSYAKYQSKKVSKEERERFINVAKEGLKKFKGAIKNSPQVGGESGEKGGVKP